MIRDQEIARQAVELAEQAHKLLMDSLGLVRLNCSKEEHEAYRAEDLAGYRAAISLGDGADLSSLRFAGSARHSC